MEWSRISPVYPAADVAVAIEWYQRVLGFEVQVVNPPGDEVPVYAVLRRDSVALHVLRFDEAPFGLRAPVQAQFWIDVDLDELFAEVHRLGVEVVQPPADQPWGHRDFMVADPDRNIVWVTRPK